MKRLPQRVRAAALGVLALAVWGGGAGPVAAQGALGADDRVVARGIVRSLADSTPIMGAELLDAELRVVARTTPSGAFALSATTGATLTIRALGFLRRTLVVGDAAGMIYLQPSATTLQTMVTTAGQRQMRAAEATQSMTIVDRRQLDAAAAIAANQVLRNLPGLQELPSPPSQTSLSIRGLDASRVLVLVDGEPTAGALIDNRDIGRLSTVAVQRIEVTKGPSSVEFGSDALGGVVNLVTAPPAEPLTFDVLVRSGALGRRESTVGVTQTVGRLGYRIDGGWRQVDRVTALNAEGPTLERVYDGRSDFRYRVSEQTEVRVNLQGARERQRWPVGGGYNGFIDNRSLQGLAELERPLAGGTARLRGFVQDFQYEYRQAAALLPIAGSADSLMQHEQLRRALASYVRDLGRHRLDLGVQYSARRITSPGKVEGNRASDHVVEVFARDAVRIGTLLITGGVRSTNSSLWGTSVNPSVGAAWEASTQWRARATVARGFRAPSFKEMRYTFLNTGGGYTIVGNDALDPESSWSTSAALTYAPAAYVAFEVEGYHNAVSNLIDTRLQGLGPDGYLRYQNVNIAEAVTRGIETSMRVTRGATQVTGGYVLLDTRNAESTLPLSRRARHTARLTLAREWPVLAGLATDVNARYSSRAPVIGSDANGAPVIAQYQGEFVSIDAQARLQVTPLMEVSAGVNNLLDQRPALFTPAFHRQVYLGAHLHWQR